MPEIWSVAIVAELIEKTRASSRTWVPTVARAVVALGAGLVVTFVPDHSAGTGLGVFAAFAIATGLVQLAARREATEPLLRRLALVPVVVGLVAGVAAALSIGTGSLAAFVWLVAVWALVAGAAELVAGLRVRDAPLAADRRVVGAATLLLGVLFAALPPHPVVSVGLLGAYGIVTGVFLAIAGVSVRLAAASETPGGTR